MAVRNLEIIAADTKRLLSRIDFPLLIASAAIVIYSLVIISSATHVNNPSEERFWFVQRQGIFAVVNVIIAVIFMNFDYRGLQAHGKALYIINLIMLLAVMLFGHAALGAQRWIQIGPISLQPSEFAKLIMIICMASVLEERVGNLNTLRDLLPIAAYVGVPFILVLKQPDLGTSLVFMAIFFGMIICMASVLEERVGNLNSLRDLLPIAAYVGVPFILVLKQPDLGTSLVFMAIFFGMIIVCGIPWRILFGLMIAGIACMPILWQFLKDYQKMRIMVFLDPNVDPLGSGYHIIQSKIAIGSGMLFGKGLFEGTQSQLNFLPENHTDFIFAVVGEELGFVGAVVLLLLYLIVLWRGIQIAKNACDIFGRLLAVGITSMLAFHVLVNVGMTTGIMPVTGIPLPLMSYGISSLTTNILAIAILMNIHMRKQKMALFS